MIEKRLGLKEIPQSILRLTADDEDSQNKLKALIKDNIKQPQPGQHTISSSFNMMRLSENSPAMSPLQHNFLNNNINNSPSFNSTITALKKVEIRLTKYFKPREEAKGLVRNEAKKEETKSNSTLSDKSLT